MKFCSRAKHKDTGKLILSWHSFGSRGLGCAELLESPAKCIHGNWTPHGSKATRLSKSIKGTPDKFWQGPSLTDEAWLMFCRAFHD